jgi:hypothetical protein
MYTLIMQASQETKQQMEFETEYTQNCDYDLMLTTIE